MKKYSLHLLTVIFLAIGIASCKKEKGLPEENTAEVLRNAQCALSQNKSDYYPKNCPAKNVVFIPLILWQVSPLHTSIHLKYSSHDNG